MKKIISLLFSLLLALVLVGCKKNTTKTNTTTTKGTETSLTLTTESTNQSSSLTNTSSIKPVEPWKSGKTVMGVELTYDLTDEMVETYTANMALAKDLDFLTTIRTLNI